MYKLITKKCVFLLLTITLVSCGGGSDSNTETNAKKDVIETEEILNNSDELNDTDSDFGSDSDSNSEADKANEDSDSNIDENSDNSSSSDSNDDSGATETQSSEQISETIINGTAVKGIVKNGIVKIYGLSNGTKDIEPLVAGKTDSNGDYSLTVENYNGPIFVEITADPNSTKMTCDIYPNCGEVPFGDEINLDSDFIIKAVVGNLEKDKPVTANINAITSLVAAQAEKQTSIDSITISDANSKVADLFGMIGNLSEKPVIDITKPEALVDVSDDIINMAILNSAIASSAVDDETSVAEGLNKLLEDFVIRDGQFLNNGRDNEVSIEKIYANAKDILNMNIFSNIEMDTLKVSISTKQAVASSMPADSISSALPTEIPEVIHIDAAKALVKDIREFSLKSTYENSEEISVAKELEQAISFIDSDDFNGLNEILELAVKALEGAYIQTMEDLKYEQDFKSPYKFEYDDTDISVFISKIDSSYFFSIDENINSIAVKLNANSTGNRTVSSQYNSDEPCNFESSEYDLLLRENVQVSFQLDGSVIGEELKMNIANGTASIIYNCNFLAKDGYNLEKINYDDFINILLDLNINITKTNNIPKPLKFSGNLKFEDKLSFSSVSEKTSDNFSYETESYAENSNLTLSGEFEQNHKKIWATFVMLGNTELGNLWINGEDLSVSDTAINNERYSESNDFNFFEILSLTSDLSESAIESALENYDIASLDELSKNSYGSGSISLKFNTSNTSDITGIDLVTSNSNSGVLNGSLKIAFGKKRLHFDYDATEENPELSITNQKVKL